MQHLDIEQQLHLREAEKTQRRSAEATLSLSYLHKEYYAAASDAILLFGGICATTGVLFLASALLVKTRLANVVRTSFQRSGASFITQWASPPLFSVCMATWMGTLGAQTVCRVLREVAQQHYRAVKETNAPALADLSLLHRVHVGDLSPRPLWGLSTDITTQYPLLMQWIMTPTALLLAAQYAGIACMWCYMLFSGHPLEAGLMAALLSFFPALYEALLLNGDEPDRWPVWVTLVNFMLSLVCLWSFGAPLARREYREVMREVRQHMAQAVFKDRPEMRKMRARGGGALKKSKQN
ncbi:hypothetical protein LSCM1_06459 [Leishmania martiniquensis]|uniref:Uncharacterized protein n=1 Tax=Leishmania martiniquensis TaxID=1580590 RepID=A0A836KVW1_9TRYP|nr:hypothetical protein LSCM1_06459 [Leishmania martiniquensis]